MNNADRKFEMKPNTGTLFKNTDKKDDKQPDYKGKILVEGIGEKDLAAWINTARDGKTKYMSLLVSEPWKPKPKAAPARPQQSAPQRDPDFDDDLPF